ncbi:hypothetical protein VP1G_03453 [Cytospora mali]|uniref:MYND-type domain-containing protein n=1 Tax=Cytospora mali TaxID=578113 RepID=A0A194UWX2_CYTMA|nr:hypothetical protein VP1G_03453 [Valsa mali var. pyri (nom. inval.)]
MSTSTSTVPISYHCAQCKLKPDKTSLCSRCRTTRYCNSTCQKAHWPTHKKICVEVRGAHGKPSSPIDMAVDPADPSNPLRLHTQPHLTDTQMEVLAGCRLPMPPGPVSNLRCGRQKALEENRADPLFGRACAWDKCGERDEDLHQGSVEELVGLLREWVYDRERNNLDIKAIRIYSQSISSRVIQRVQIGDLPTRSQTEEGMRLAQVAIQVREYTECRQTKQNIIGKWLHESLLKKLPADHDYSRFEFAICEPDKYIVATLLALHADGIDEGSFWELEDYIDGQKLKANSVASHFYYPSWVQNSRS